MLSRIIDNQLLVDNVVRKKIDGLSTIQEKRLRAAALTPDDWELLRALHGVLRCFSIATTILSGSFYPTQSDAFWSISKLRQILKSTDDDSHYSRLLKNTAANYLDAYVQKHISKEQQNGMLVGYFLLISPTTLNSKISSTLL